MKVPECDPNGEKGETSKGKCSYISTITGGAPRAKLSSKGTIKIKIANIMVV